MCFFHAFTPSIAITAAVNADKPAMKSLSKLHRWESMYVECHYEILNLYFLLRNSRTTACDTCAGTGTATLSNEKKVEG